MVAAGNFRELARKGSNEFQPGKEQVAIGERHSFGVGDKGRCTFRSGGAMHSGRIDGVTEAFDNRVHNRRVDDEWGRQQHVIAAHAITVPPMG